MVLLLDVVFPIRLINIEKTPRISKIFLQDSKSCFREYRVINAEYGLYNPLSKLGSIKTVINNARKMNPHVRGIVILKLKLTLASLILFTSIHLFWVILLIIFKI